MRARTCVSEETHAQGPRVQWHTNARANTRTCTLTPARAVEEPHVSKPFRTLALSNNRPSRAGLPCFFPFFFSFRLFSVPPFAPSLCTSQQRVPWQRTSPQLPSAELCQHMRRLDHMRHLRSPPRISAHLRASPRISAHLRASPLLLLFSLHRPYVSQQPPRDHDSRALPPFLIVPAHIPSHPHPLSLPQG
eukprot:6173659-Pleurochrysis_carterae.AAC.3